MPSCRRKGLLKFTLSWFNRGLLKITLVLIGSLQLWYNLALNEGLEDDITLRASEFSFNKTSQRWDPKTWHILLHVVHKNLLNPWIHVFWKSIEILRTTPGIVRPRSPQVKDITWVFITDLQCWPNFTSSSKSDYSGLTSMTKLFAESALIL